VTTDERARLFCALQLPPSAVAAIGAWQLAHLGVAAVGHTRIVPPENLHVTLAFLGPRPLGELPAIAHELREAAAAAAAADLRPLRYRETRTVGMLVCEDVGGAAGALAAELSARLERLAVLRHDARRWLPHITVLRFRTPTGLSPPVANTCSIHVVRSALYRSVLGAGGARYDALETAALGGR
jgi:RNA 2',3'-cyclic 3'-phosphodiesterase